MAKLRIISEIFDVDENGNEIIKSRNSMTRDFVKIINFDIKAEAENEDSALSLTNR